MEDVYSKYTSHQYQVDSNVEFLITLFVNRRKLLKNSTMCPHMLWINV